MRSIVSEITCLEYIYIYIIYIYIIYIYNIYIYISIYIYIYINVEWKLTHSDHCCEDYDQSFRQVLSKGLHLILSEMTQSTECSGATSLCVKN